MHSTRPAPSHSFFPPQSFSDIEGILDSDPDGGPSGCHSANEQDQRFNRRRRRAQTLSEQPPDAPAAKRPRRD